LARKEALPQRKGMEYQSIAKNKAQGISVKPLGRTTALRRGAFGVVANEIKKIRFEQELVMSKK